VPRGVEVLLLCLFLSACGSEPLLLDGSLTQICDLDYARSDLKLERGAASVRFLRPRESGDDVVLQVKIITTGLELVPGQRIDLAERVADSGQRGSVTRYVFQDEHTDFPRIIRGALVLKADPFDVENIDGEFTVTFEQGADFGSGRNVFGPFHAGVTR
jgi:hypothetical protein